MASSTEQHVLASLKSSLESGQYSDLKITCGVDSYNVHRVIACRQVEFFARAVKFGGKESAEGKIDLPEEEAAVIKLLIQYLYEGDYEPQLPDKRCGLLVNVERPRLSSSGNPYWYDFPHTCPDNNQWHEVCPHHRCEIGWGQVTLDNCTIKCKNFVCKLCCTPVSGDSSQLLLHIEMYNIADKYQAAGLKDLAAEKFYRACRHFWDKPDFVTAARQACATTPGHCEGLRDSLAKVMSEHINQLIKKPEIEEMLKEFTGLAFSVLKLKIEAD